MAELAGRQVPGAEATAGLFGLMRLGAMVIALPTEMIREVVPRPETFLAFPAALPQVIGAVSLRGQIIPVLELETLLGPTFSETRQRTSSIVVVLRHGCRVLGILVDSIEGVSSLLEQAGSLIETAGTAADSQIVKSTFVLAQSAGVMLDVQALVRMPGVPVVADMIGQTEAAQKGVEPTLIFRIGTLTCALPAACVDASLPEQQIAPIAIEHGLWIGMLRHNGAEIPVLDSLALLQQGTLRGRTRGGAVVLRVREESQTHGEFGLVALLIDAVEDIVRLTPGTMSPLGADLAAMPFVTGLLEREAGPCLMVDGDRIAADSRLIRLGKIRQGGLPAHGVAAGSSDADNAAHDDKEPYLVFVCGEGRFAAPLAAIEEILPGGSKLIELDGGASNVIGLLPRRGRAVPVMNFRASLGLGPQKDEDCGFVVIARVDCPDRPARVGFAVDALKSVQKARAQRLKIRARQVSGSRPSLLEHTIRLDDGSACSVLDLPRMAIELLADGHPAAAA